MGCERFRRPEIVAATTWRALALVASPVGVVVRVLSSVACGAAIAARRVLRPVSQIRAQGLLMRLRPATSERGQALIEFAFVFPVLLIFLLALTDFGIALDRREVTQHAAREGTRKGAVGWTVREIEDEVVNQSQGVLSEDNIEVCYVDVDANGSALEAGDNVRVTIDFTYEFSVGAGELLNAIGAGVPGIHMTPTAESRLEAAVGAGTECLP